MHFAYPPRKSSNPPPFRPRTSRIPLYRRRQLKTIALVGVSILFLGWLLFGGSHKRKTGGVSTSGSTSQSTTTTTSHKPIRVPSGKPPVVLVTVFDKNQPAEYIELLRQNRIQYAEKHGYGTVFADTQDYDLAGAPHSWAKVPALRHAMTMYPEASYLWFLEQNAYITNLDLTIHKDIMSPSQLDAFMMRDQSVAPPDGIIKTWTSLKGEDVDLAITQDKDGLATGSFVLRNGDYAEFLLDTLWNDLYRSYRFQKAETHALSHVVQWHQTILGRMAILPQNLLGGYSTNKQGKMYQEGDLVVLFKGCGGIGSGSCTSQAKAYSTKSG